MKTTGGAVIDSGDTVAGGSLLFEATTESNTSFGFKVNNGTTDSSIATASVQISAPTTPTLYRMSNSTSSATYACNISTYPLSVFANNNTFLLNSIVYQNSSLSTTFTGDSSWYKLNKDGGLPIRIDSNGKIVQTTLAPCVPT